LTTLRWRIGIDDIALARTALNNFYIALDQTSEAGNENYCNE
jgi:hypothetical protein